MLPFIDGPWICIAGSRRTYASGCDIATVSYGYATIRALVLVAELSGVAWSWGPSTLIKC